MIIKEKSSVAFLNWKFTAEFTFERDCDEITTLMAKSLMDVLFNICNYVHSGKVKNKQTAQWAAWL